MGLPDPTDEGFCVSFHPYSIFRLLVSQTSYLIVQSCDDRRQSSYSLSGPLRRPTCGQQQLLGILMSEQLLGQGPVEALHNPLV